MLRVRRVPEYPYARTGLVGPTVSIIVLDSFRFADPDPERSPTETLPEARLRRGRGRPRTTIAIRCSGVRGFPACGCSRVIGPPMDHRRGRSRTLRALARARGGSGDAKESSFRELTQMVVAGGWVPGAPDFVEAGTKGGRNVKAEFLERYEPRLRGANSAIRDFDAARFA